MNNSEWGFDLTSISSANWKKVLKAGSIPEEPCLEEGMWVWKGSGVKIHTGNNPITGVYSKLGMRRDEKNYASYIGIYGESAIVKKIAKMISKLASNIKEETPNDSGFI